MSSSEARVSGFGYELSEDTARFFSALAVLSAQPGRVENLEWHVNQFASRADMATTFGPIGKFMRDFHSYGDQAIDRLDLSSPEGLPVQVVVDYDYENGQHSFADGTLVGLFDAHDSEHGAYSGLAVTDLGNGSGPQAIDVALRSNAPGIVYLA